MQKTVFINVQGHNVQAAITGMIEQMDKMSADPKFKDFEFHSSNITVTFEAPPKKSNLVPMNGGMVQPVMIINHTVTLVEKTALPGLQEIADLKKAYQMKCPHAHLSPESYFRTMNGEKRHMAKCLDCNAEVTIDGDGPLATALHQIPIDPIGDQVDDQDRERFNKEEQMAGDYPDPE